MYRITGWVLEEIIMAKQILVGTKMFANNFPSFSVKFDCHFLLSPFDILTTNFFNETINFFLLLHHFCVVSLRANCFPMCIFSSVFFLSLIITNSFLTPFWPKKLYLLSFAFNFDLYLFSSFWFLSLFL